jgi:phage regulator Rha-like protein
MSIKIRKRHGKLFRMINRQKREGVSKCTLFFVCKKIKQSLDFHKPRLCHVIKFL